MRSLNYGIIFVMLCILVTKAYGGNAQVIDSNIYSFDNTLDHYGFSTKEQKKALNRLLFISSSIQGSQLPLRHTKEDVIKDIICILHQTQKNFVARKGTQERWEVKGLPWVASHEKEVLTHLDTLGCINAIKPREQHVDAFCILGAAAGRMNNRLNYVNSLLEEGKSTRALIFLVGERYVTKNIDGTESELRQLAERLHMPNWQKLTETHMIHALYEKSALRNKNIPTYTIDTPRGDLPRPTTQTSILQLLAWLKDHPEIRRITFVSNQPHVAYQKAIIDAIFRDQGVDILYEVIGDAVQNPQKVDSIVGGLGSYIWAQTPSVLHAMGTADIGSDVQKELRTLYAQTPLLYSSLPKVMRS